MVACSVILLKGKKITYYSQFNEDALVDGLFRKIGTTNKILVDIGAADGKVFSNTRFFMEQDGWDGAFVEPDPIRYKQLTDIYPSEKCLQDKVTADNTIDGLLGKMSFPRRFDLLNIDIDGQDYYVWSDMTKYRARVVIIEWSPYVDLNFIPPRGSDGDGGMNQTGMVPMLRLAYQKDYKVIAVTPVNLICVEGRLLEDWKDFWNGEFPLHLALRKEII